MLEIDPDNIRIVRPDPGELAINTPVGSRMAIMMGGACYHAAQKLKSKLVRIAAHQFGIAESDAVYAQGSVTDPKKSGKTLSWAELVNIGHRQFHALPEGMEPGLETTHVMQVPTGTKLPGERPCADVSLSFV